MFSRRLLSKLGCKFGGLIFGRLNDSLIFKSSRKCTNTIGT